MASTTGPEAETLPFQRIMSTILSTKSSGEFHDKWSSLAIALHTPGHTIKRIRDDRLVNKITLMDALHEIIEEWYTRCGSAATINKLIRAFEDLDLNSLGETLRLEFNLPCKDSENPSIAWDDIGSRFQQRVISSLETFYPSITFDHKLKSKLAGVVLVDLMTCKEPNPITTIIPQTLSYYVPRTLIPKDFLAKEFIRLSSDIFLFTGISISALSTVISSKSRYPRTDTTSNQISNRDRDVKYMILDRPNHFEKIKALSGSPVHHVKFEEGHFYWVKSIGSLDNLRKCIDNHQIHLSEGEFLNRLCTASVTNRPVIISDSPGMGKSEILKQIADKITNIVPGRIVIFQEFPKFISFAIQLNKGTNERMVRIHSALQKLTCKNELGRKILSSKLKSETVTIELLLDGYDELSTTFAEVADDIIKEIYFSFKSIRLWFTTRPHLLKSLEDMLTVLGHTIHPFTPEDQINFLVSYWSRDRNLPTDRLAQYATHCLDYLKSTLSAKDEDIAGIPLQCLMIGEVYEEEAIDYSQSNTEFSGIKIWITSITDLYKLTITKKFRKYQSKYGSPKLSDKELISMHIQLSLKLVFPDYFSKVSSKFGRVEKKDVLNVGILESKGSDSEPKFIHRTFAEYFISLLVLNVLVDENWLGGDSDNGNLPELRLKEVLQCKPTLKTEEFQYPVMCFFLNSLLSEKEVQARFSHPFVELFKSRMEIRKLAGACINSDFIHIFNLFDNFKAFDKCGKQFFNEVFFLNAIQKSSADLIKKILQKFERFHELHIGFQKAAIKAAVARGEFTPVEFLLSERRFHKLMQGENWERMQILHCCVENSKDNSQEIIRQKVEVIQFLVQINSLILEETNNERMTPLVLKNVHFRLLVKLIELGSNVFAKNDKNDTILHYTYFTPEEYHIVLTSIKMENIVKLVNVEGGNLKTPILTLIAAMEPEGKTLDIFKDAGVDFNSCKASLHPCLPTAIEHGRNATTLNKLMQCGSDVGWKGTNGYNLLHLAAQNGNLDAVSLMVDNNVDINALDNEFDTPLHIAATLEPYGNSLKMIRVLIECGGNAIVLNKGGNTFLHELLLSHRNITSADFHDLIELLVQVNGTNLVEVGNQVGNPFLVVALSMIDVEEKTLSLLRKLGVNLLKSTTGAVFVTGNATDITEVVVVSNADKNLLHAASHKGNYKVIPFLLQIGLNVNGRDSSSMMPLHYACNNSTPSPEENCFATIKTLIDNGANVYATADGATFLHILLGKCYFITSIQFHELAEFLVKNDHPKLFNIHGKNGVIPLQLAVALPCVKDETISLLSTSGVNFDSVDDDGDSVLAYAIRGKKGRDWLKHLISCGGNVQQTNNKGQNLLHIAASCHNDGAIVFILKLGISVNEVDMDGNTPLHLHFESWLNSNKSSRLPITSVLIGNGASVTKLIKKSMSPFAIARRRFPDDDELIQLLSKRLAEEIGILDEKGNSELHNAAFANNLPLVKKLVKIGVNLNVQNKKLETSLHIASSINEKNDALKIIRLLVDNNSDPFINDRKNCTFLHILLATNTNLIPSQFHDLVDYLISKGHSKLLETPGWDNGTTPIHLALNNIDVEERTVSQLSTYVDWNLVDYLGRTPLHFITSSKGNSSVTCHLVQLGADYKILDNSENSLLHCAAEHGNIDALEYFLNLGLNVNGTNSDGNTPLHVALLRDPDNVSEIINILDGAGANSNLKNNLGQTSFFVLAQKINTTKQLQHSVATDASTNTD